MVHLSPLFCAFVAIAASRLWESGNLPARMVTVVQAAVVLLGVASLAYSASGRHLQREYQPAVAFLNAHIGPGDLVFARSEFYFRLECRACLRDDRDLGAFSGRLANFIVLDAEYNDYLASLRETNPAIYRDIERRLSVEYREVFHNVDYRVLQTTIRPVLEKTP